METSSRKSADEILRQYREMPETYESIEAARQIQAKTLLRRILVDVAFQEELITEYEGRQRGFARSSYPDWAVKLAQGLVREDAGKRRTIWEYSKKLHDEAGVCGERPLATMLAREIEVRILSDVARGLLRAER